MNYVYEEQSQRFEAWLDILLSNKQAAQFIWSGLLVSMFRTMIRAGDSRVKDVWLLISPFQETTAYYGARFVADLGIHWLLAELSAPDADDELASLFLKETVTRALTDQDLFHLALAARLYGQKRLANIVDSFIADPSAELRARAVRIIGWLENTAEQVAGVECSDPSLWVRRVAAEAMQDQAKEKWARHWFSIFTRDEEKLEVRWGAGQLFLGCTDKRFHLWAWSSINQTGLTGRTRGEALLLLDAAQKTAEKRERKLQETFLLHKVSELQSVCSPWHPSGTWDNVLSG